MGGHGTGRAIRTLSMEKKKATRPLGVLLKGLGKYLTGYKGLLAFAATLSLVYAATQLVNPLILSIGIDAVDTTITDPVWLFSLDLKTLSGLNLALLFGGLFILFGLL